MELLLAAALVCVVAMSLWLAANAVRKLISKLSDCQWYLQKSLEKLTHIEGRIDYSMGCVQDVSRHVTERLLKYRGEQDSNPARFNAMRMWLRIELDYFCLRRDNNLTHWAGICTCCMLNACIQVIRWSLKPGTLDMSAKDVEIYGHEESKCFRFV